MQIREISLDIAKPFIIKWHYSARCPTGRNIFFGWYIKSDEYGLQSDNEFGETLYAVADYGNGVNPYQAKSLSKLAGTDVRDDNLLELRRLCRIEPKIDELPLSLFLSKCHKLLKQKGFQYIVAFSDPTYGHSGGIYRASNFQHLGKTSAQPHAVEADGTIRHRRYYFRYARRNNIDMAQARKELGLEFIKTEPKDRWFIQIN